MDYRVIRRLSGEDENSIEAHVLARAYRAVWRCTHGSEPVGKHQIAGLQLVIDFGGQAKEQVDAPYKSSAQTTRQHLRTGQRAEPASTSWCEQSATAPMDTAQESDVTADLWARVRMFGKRMPSEELERVIAELRAEEQPRNSGSRKNGQCYNRRRDD